MQKRTIQKKILIFSVILLVVYVGLRFLAFYMVERMLINKLKQDYAGHHIQFQELKVGPWENQIEIKALQIDPVDTTTPYSLIHADISTIKAEGISLYRALVNKELRIRSIAIIHPDISYVKRAVRPARKDTSANDKGLRKLSIDQLYIKEASYSLSDSLFKPALVARFEQFFAADLSLAGLNRDTITWHLSQTTVKKVRFSLPKDFYDIKLQKFSYTSFRKELSIDSVDILPYFGKEEFARRSGKEIDRFSGSIYSLQMRSFEFSNSLPFAFQATHAGISFHIDCYRDKRQPFMKNVKTELPIELINSLPLAVRLDTIEVKNSYASYEEFPATNTFPGKVFFENLTASLYDINNRDHSRSPQLKAGALFMGNGKLSADFRLPKKPYENYYVTGSLRDFDLPKLNPVLESAVKGRIESGLLKSLEFSFAYNDVQSEGEVKLDYENLTLAGLKEDVREKAAVKSFLLNLFVPSQTKQPGKIEEKKTGQIAFERNQKRSIFNYWWKSILSGIKDAYLPGKQEKKAPKK